MRIKSRLLFTVVILFGVLTILKGLSYAGEDQRDAILFHTANSEGIPAENLEISYQDYFPLPLTGRGYYLNTIIDKQTGNSYSLGLDQNGNLVDYEALRAEEKAVYRAKYGKLHPALHHALETKGADEPVKVSIWLNMGNRTAAIERPTPQEARILGREEIQRLKQEGISRARLVHAEVEKPVIDFLKLQGYEAIGSGLAPMVFADLPGIVIEHLTHLPEVDTIDLVVKGGPEDEEMFLSGGPEAYSARRTEKADVVESRGITGSGVELAVIEGDAVSDANAYLDNATHSVTFCNSRAVSPIDDHATAVGGFMSSTHSTARGTAPSAAGILSGNSEAWDLAAYQTCTSWAIGEGASALNNSYYLEIDGVMHNSDRWADYIVRHYWDNFVKSAGNRGESDGNVTSPGLGYNIITVGAIDDFDNNDWDDDRIAGLSSYIEPSGREKPEVVAVGCAQWNPGDPTTGMVSTTIGDPWTGNVGCGTSYAAPAVTGMVATLIDRDSGLEIYPEAVKAIAIASALHNIEGSSRISEYDGAGAIDMAAADYIAANGWWDGRSITGDSFTAQKLQIATVSLNAGERFRAALAYDSNPSSDYTSDPLEGNLNLYLYDINDTLVAWSTRSSDSWEIIEWDVTTSGDYKLVVWNYGNSLTSTESTKIGVAWWPGHYVLSAPIQTRVTPTSAQDHYRVATTSPADWWAIALRPPTAANYNIYLYDGSRYDNPANFIWLEDSTLSGDTVDITVIDRNHATAKSYYPVVNQVSGTGSYDIQRAIMGGEISSGSTSQTTTSLFVAKVWDIAMTAGVTKYFSIVPTSGNADLGMLLFDSDPLSSSTWYQGRSQAVASSDSAGAGGSESFTATAGTSDTMGLVVFNKRGQTVNTTWTLYVDETAPTGSISINSGAAYTTSTSVTLTLSASDTQTGVSQMRFSNDNATWSAWETYGTSKAWTLTSGDGTKTVYVQYKNKAGMTSASISDTIVLDTTPPGGTISINAGAVYTTSTSVTLTLSCSDATSGCYQMRFSNNNTTWSAWEANAVSKAWTLTSGDGTKTVYVQYKDNAGNSSGSFSDTIVLDATAPTGTISINSGAVATTSTSVTLTLSCKDGGSGCYQMRFSNDNATWSAWEANAISKAWTLTSGEGTKTVYVQYKDNAGNASASFFDDILLLPIVSVTLVPDSTSIPRGGTLGYTVTVKNNTSTSQTFKYWTYVKLPNGSRYPTTGELLGPVTVTLTAGQTKSAHLSQKIPTTAPLGIYTYYGNVGPYPSLWDSDSFNFTVTTAAPSPEGVAPQDKWELLEDNLN